MKKETITAKTCLSCGACCVSYHDQEVFCDVTPTDEERLGRTFVRLNVLRPRIIDTLGAAIDGRHLPYGAIKTKWRKMRTGPLKGYEVCGCVALQGTVLEKVSCKVYEKRPDACRNAVKPGDKTCRQIRRMVLEKLEE